jgi:hypothetical protein
MESFQLACNIPSALEDRLRTALGICRAHEQVVQGSVSGACSAAQLMLWQLQQLHLLRRLLLLACRSCAATLLQARLLLSDLTLALQAPSDPEQHHGAHPLGMEQLV